MNKKAQKGLVSALAAVMSAGIAAPVFASAATTDLDAKYKAAYDAVMVALKSNSQKDLTAARVLVDALYVDVKGTSNESLATTLSSLLDPVQQVKLVELFKAIDKADASVKQADINTARSLILDMPQVWLSSFSSRIDQVQNKLIKAVVDAVAAAKASGSQADLDKATALLNDLLTVTNNDGVKTWAQTDLKAEYDKAAAVVVDTYNNFKAAVDAKVAAYEKLANGDLSTQALIDAARVAKTAISLEGLKDADKTAMQTRIDAADAKVTAAQKVIDDAKTYAELKAGVETKVAAYEKLATGDLSTQALVDAAKAAKAVIVLDGLKDADKAAFQARIDAADKFIAAAEKVSVAETSRLKADFDAAKALVDALVDGKVKTDLTARLAKIVVKAEVVSVVNLTNTNAVTVTLKDDVKAEALTGRKLTLTPATGAAVTATFKSLDGKVATFEFDAKAANGEYVVTGADFIIADGTKVTYDNTKPTLNVTDSKFADYQTIKVAFSEKVSGTPQVKINGVDEKVENVKLADDGLSMTITRTAGFAQGLYTVTVNGLTDVAKNAMLADASMNIRKDASYVNQFNFTTTGVSKNAGNKVYFRLVDQYSQDLTDTITGTYDVAAVMNNLPLAVSGITKDAFGAYITITDALTSGSTVKVTLTSKDAQNKVLATATSPSYTVSSSSAAATKIVAIKSAKTEAPSGTTLTLTADVRDQFNNPGSTSNLTWTTSDINVVGLPGGASFYKESTGSIVVNANAVGTAQVKAFLSNGTEVDAPITINVTQGQLNTITPQITALSVTNNKVSADADVLVNINPAQYPAGTDYVEFKNASNKNISVKASDVELSSIVTATGKDASAEVSFEKVADSNGNLVGVKIKTNRTDVATLSKNYTVTLKVGDKSNTFAFDSVIDTTVSSIEVGDVAANALTTSNKAVVPVTFKNKYGEKVTVSETNFNVSQLGSLTIEEGTVDANGTFSAVTGAAAVTHIRYTGTSAATYNVFFSVGNATLQKSVTVVPAGTVTGMTLGSSNVSVIKDDTLDAVTPSTKDDTYVDGNGLTYKLVPVSFVDNYGNAIDVTSASISKTGADNLDVQYYSDAVGTTTGSIKYIGVREDNLDASTSTAQRNVTFEVKDGNGKVLASSNLLVDVKAARTLDHLTVDKAAASAVVGATTSFKVSGVDQYGRPSNIGALALDSDFNGALVKANEVVSGADVTFDLTASKAGSYAAKLKYTVGQVTKSVDVLLNVGEIGNVINNVVIDPIVNTYDSSKYQVKFVSGTTKVVANAFDANGNSVALNSGDVNYYIDSVKATNDTAPTLSIDPNTGIITGSNVEDGDKVVVRATSLNGKTTTMTITLGVSGSVAQAGTYFVSDDADGYNAQNKEVAPLTSLELKDDSNPATNDKVKNLFLVARDQYGKLFNVDESLFTFGKDSSEFFTAVATDADTDTKVDTLVVTAKAEGTSTIRVFLNGTQVTTVTVTVNKNVLP